MTRAAVLRLLGRRSDERGAVLVLVALSLTMLMGATALSFDIGREVDSNRRMQAVADAAASDAAAFLTGGLAGAPYSGTSGPTLAAYVQTQAVDSAARNGFVAGTDGSLGVVLGTWNGSGVTTNAAVAPDAVEVTASTTTGYVFAAPRDGTSTRHAIAVKAINRNLSNPPIAGFTVGSYVANVDTTQAALLNGILGSLGTGVNLTAVGYNGLAAATIDVQDIVDANPSVGTVQNLLSLSTVSPPGTLLGYYDNALLAEAASLLAAGQAGPAAVLQGAEATIQSGIRPTTTVKTGIALCELVDVGSTSACSESGTALAPAAYADLNALDLVRSIAEIADGSNGVKLSTTAGLVTANSLVIAPVAVAGPGPVYNAAGGYATTATDQQGSVALSIGNGLLGSLALSIKVNVSAAQATGTLEDISCGPSPATTTTGVDVSSTAATASPTITLGGLPVVGSGSSVGTVAATALTFTGPFSAATPPQSVGTADPDLTVTAKLAGTNLTLLDNFNSVLPDVLEALGVNLGGATVVDDTVTCGVPTLVG